MGANDVLEVLQETRVVLILSLGFHHRDLLHLALPMVKRSRICDPIIVPAFFSHAKMSPVFSYLQDEEPIVVKVDAMSLELLSHILGWRLAVVNVVVGLVAAVSCAGNTELRSRDSLKLLTLLCCMNE